MAKINILDQNTINQIAAGEVIERPASVVKELIENAIDAGSNAITCEIKGGGIEMIRVTDNGCGIEPSEIRKAFTSHATSKIKTAADILDVMSLGFRGEALASIASVAEVELLTKLTGEVMGTRYVIACGEERTLCDAGCPEGTTIIVSNLFANVPARRKFLKSAVTEASYISDLVEKIALSHPEVSIKYINNGKTVIFTKGNNKLDEVIYGIYGRDITSSLVEVDGRLYENIMGLKNSCAGINRQLSDPDSTNGIFISGYIAKPIVTRSNRGMEHYFVNGRYIRNNIISKAIEEAYAPYMMQHRYPFTVLNIRIDAERIDVNVHPSKQEIRFEQPQDIFNAVYAVISSTLKQALMIPDSGNDQMDTPKEARERILSDANVQKAPEPFEMRRQGSGIFPDNDINNNSKRADQTYINPENTGFVNNKNANCQNGSNVETYGKYEKYEKNNVGVDGSVKEEPKSPQTETGDFVSKETGSDQTEFAGFVRENSETEQPSETQEALKEHTTEHNETASQLRFTIGGESKDVIDGFRPETSEEFKKGLEVGYNIIGQVFATYWIVEKGSKMYLIDQHAAHEKIIYERICAHNANTVFDSQMLSPSIIMSFTPTECACIEEHLEDFRNMGFELEHFSGTEYHVSAVPLMLYSLDPKELIHEIVDSFITVNSGVPGTMLKNVSHSESLKDRLATCSCKAAVKGNTKLSYEEAHKLIEDLLKLENPFNCPHGRPVIIEMTKQELEKKFKRIV